MRIIGSILFIATILTGGIAQAQGSDCRFTGTLETLALRYAPLTNPYQIKDQLPGGISYPVLASHGEHYLIAVDDAYGGWVDRRSGLLSGNCDSVPVDPTPLADFPTVCIFHQTAAKLTVYPNSALTTEQGQIVLDWPLAVIDRTEKAYLLQIDHAMSIWVSAKDGTISGMCAGLGEQGDTGQPVTVLDNARLWSQPDAQTGHVLATLAPGSAVEILAGPVRGPIRLDNDAQGDWYEVRQGIIIGWLWGERLLVEGDAIGTATTLENARLWSQPDVHTGHRLVDLPVGLTVEVLAGPVRGPLRADIDFEGDWMQVRAGDRVGWVWIERLAFES